MPAKEPAAALRLTFYVDGLVCFAGVYVFQQAWLSHPRVILAMAMSALLVAGMAFFFLACRSTVPRALSHLLPYSRALLAGGLATTLMLAGAGLGVITQIPGGIAKPQHLHVDNVAMTACGINLFLHGHNAYTDFYLVDCLPRYGLAGDAATPLQAGRFAHARLEPSPQELIRVFAQARQRHIHWPAEFEAHFSYPAGAFVLPAPFMALVWPDLSVFYLLCLLLAYVALAWWAPRRLRPWLVPLALANINIWSTAIGYADDSLDILLILAGWATWRRAWLSAILLGAALATRQNAWFFLPFYAILIVRTDGWRALAHRLAVMAGVFGVINGPFFLQSPAAWVDGVLGTLRDPMYSVGIGLTALVRHGWLPLWPRPAYALAELAVMAAGALYYARTCRRQPGTGLVLALLPFLVAWRSAFIYFMPLTVVCLWPLLDDLAAGAQAGMGQEADGVKGQAVQPRAV